MATRQEQYTDLIRAEAKARYWLRKNQSYEAKHDLVLAKMRKAQFEGELMRKLDAADELCEHVNLAIEALKGAGLHAGAERIRRALQAFQESN